MDELVNNNKASNPETPNTPVSPPKPHQDSPDQQVPKELVEKHPTSSFQAFHLAPDSRNKIIKNWKIFLIIFLGIILTGGAVFGAYKTLTTQKPLPEISQDTERTFFSSLLSQIPYQQENIEDDHQATPLPTPTIQNFSANQPPYSPANPGTPTATPTQSSSTSAPTATPTQSTSTSTPTPTSAPVPTNTLVPTPTPATSPQELTYESDLMTVTTTCVESGINVFISDNTQLNPYPDGIWTYLLNNGQYIYLGYVGPDGRNASASIYTVANSIRGTNSVTMTSGSTFVTGFAPGAWTIGTPSLGSPIAEITFTNPQCN